MVHIYSVMYLSRRSEIGTMHEKQCSRLAVEDRQMLFIPSWKAAFETTCIHAGVDE
jgi:hypothetical protein